MSHHNKNILLIEPSATQRYVMEKTLRAHDYKLCVASSFELGLEFLGKIKTAPGCSAAVVLGWPSQPVQSFDMLLRQLEFGKNIDIPVLVISQEVDTAGNDWVASRSRTLRDQ